MPSAGRRTSIVLADDHPVVLHGVAGILKLHPDLEVVATCSDGAAAAQAIRNFAPDLAVLDLGMPGLNGLAVLSGITADGYGTKVVFLTASVTDDQIAAAMAGGAKGIVLKDAAPASLLHCIREVLAGQRWFPADLVAAALEREAGHQLERARLIHQLTAREQQVVLLVSDAISNKEIARRLDLTEGTVKVHLHNIYEKLGVSNRTALTVLAIAHRDQLRL
jgi:two-component system nitrate/nitrite response regulator NarL